MRYPALIEQGGGIYGLVFPDLPGVAVTADTIEEAIDDAADVLREYVEVSEGRGFEVPPASDLKDVDVPIGNTLVSIPLIRPSHRKVQVHCQLDDGIVAFIDEECRRRNMTRTAYITWMARRIAAQGG